MMPMGVNANTFWYRIDLLRKSKDMTLIELQERIGFRGAYIYSMRNRSIIPSLDTVWKIADVFGCSIDYLIGRDDMSSRKVKNSDEMQKIHARLVADENFFSLVSSMMKI